MDIIEPTSRAYYYSDRFLLRCPCSSSAVLFKQIHPTSCTQLFFSVFTDS